MRYRVAIIGAGIVGTSIARVLSRYENLDIHVIEKNPDVGWGVSKANTGLIHGGYDDDPDKYPLRAKLCIRGNEIWHRWVKELEIPHVWNGALVVALRDEDIKELEVLRRRGERNGVEGLRIISRKELLDMEPLLTPDAKAALFVPNAGQLSPVPAVIALAENSVSNGVKFHLATEVRKIGVKNGAVRWLETNRGRIDADIIINASGLYADSISRMLGIGYFTITPRKGEYLIFDEGIPAPSRILFPTPTPKSKGVVVTKEIGGHLMIGPNAQDLDRKDKENFATTLEGLKEVRDKAKKLWPRIPENGVIRSFAGLRPEPTGGDFIIRSEELWGFLNVAGIRSPGLTSAPAIAYHVRDLLIHELDVKLVEKKKWNPYRKDILRISRMSKNQASSLIGKRPQYGRIVCRCNLVTEGEVMEAIERMRYIGVPQPSIDSVKFRTKATGGTCQGSFCRPKIAWLLAREYEVPLWKVTLKGEGSELGIGDIKVLLRGDGK